MKDEIQNDNDLNGVAIIGMAGRFPNAGSIDEFWQNLRNGVDCITFYADQELIEAGINPEVLKHPDYVKAKGEVDNVDMFDASFFGINPREAEVTDPQHRMLLECAYEAMEHAGYDSGKYEGSIGVYGGKSMDYYLLLNVYPYIKKEISAGSLQAAIGNDKDSLTTTISYRLNLTGPGITIQTSSSTSLVAVCVACQSLLTYQCDIALAGGITAGPPIRSGYLYQEGNIWSRDGHCRAFAAESQGFVPGCGMGMVVLKRLEDALPDRDNIWAVIKGFAVNNDGDKKVSYSAPSVDAQAEVVAEAQAVAGVHPESIQYIETHGTATNLGDPIEMTALTQAFRAQTGKKQFCAIGSAKSNIGHLDNAAGVAGLIKTALSLKYKQIPPSLHYEKPNPKIDFENSPFFVNTELREWKSDGSPRRAGVTSLGMGGTNAHVIVEEWPESPDAAADSRQDDAGEWQLLLLSAKTGTALDKMTHNLMEHLGDNTGIDLTAAAYTLASGRRDFNYRRAVLCRDLEDTVTSLKDLTPGRVFDSLCNILERPVIFMFSGQGSQYVNMGKGLYQEQPVFKENMDRCAEFLLPVIGSDLRELIYPEKEEDIAGCAEKLKETRITQPVLFMLEYSLARLWQAWGLQPAGMVGHSIGEFAAACIAGCISLEDALTLVAARGQLMYDLDKGAMLAVGLVEAEIKEMLGEELSLAAVNGPERCVVSGSTAAVEKLEKQLSEKNIFCKQLRTSHAFHSPMMEPIMATFAATVGKIDLQPAKIPFISGVTGTWIRDEEAVDPQYWAQQLRKPVRFSDGIREIMTDPSRVLLEIGPGNSLCLLAKEHKTGASGSAPVILSSIRHIKQTEPDEAFLLKSLAGLWGSGVFIDWKNYYQEKECRRIPLPSYPFERKRYWLDEVKDSAPAAQLDMEQETVQPQAEAAEEECIKDREARAKAFQPRPALPNEYTAPTDEIEAGIVAIWEDILGIKPIGVKDNFFDLGGHSLLATLFLSRLQEEFHVRLEMRSIFEEPTAACVAGLVKAEQSKTTDVRKIEDILREVEEDEYQALTPADELEYYVLSLTQERFYMLHSMDINSKSYNMTGLMTVAGKLEKKKFETSFAKLIRRHESLRTSVKIVGGKAWQKIHKPKELEFEIEYFDKDKSLDAPEVRKKKDVGEPGVGAQRAVPLETETVINIIQQFIRPFDLSQAPLLRIGLIRMEDEKHILMFDMHHIISDGFSMSLLVKDLSAFYAGREKPPLPIQYKDYCVWQNRLLTSGKLEKQGKYWLDHFSGELPQLDIPTDFPRPEYQSFAGDVIGFFYDEELTRKLNSLMRETGTTLFMLLLALFNILLSKSSGQEDIIIGFPTAGRNHKYLENIIGLFMETLTVRSFPTNDKTFAGFLGEVKENTLNAFENQAYPFGELIKQVSNKSGHSRNPLFDAMLIVQNIEGNLEEIEMGALRLVPYEAEAQRTAKVDLCLEAEEKDGKIFFKLKYASALFKRESMEYLAGFFKEITSAVLENKDIKLQDIKVTGRLKSAGSHLYKEMEFGFEF